MNPNTGELILIRNGEKMPAGYEILPRGVESREAMLKLRIAALAGLAGPAFSSVKAKVDLRHRSPLAIWAKKKRKAKLAAASRRKNRK